MIEEAKAVARIESDKLWNYEDIRKYIHKNFEPIGYWDEINKKVIK